jgi:hypothetical protein
MRRVPAAVVLLAGLLLLPSAVQAGTEGPGAVVLRGAVPELVCSQATAEVVVTVERTALGTFATFAAAEPCWAYFPLATVRTPGLPHAVFALEGDWASGFTGRAVGAPGHEVDFTLGPLGDGGRVPVALITRAYCLIGTLTAAA